MHDSTNKPCKCSEDKVIRIREACRNAAEPDRRLGGFESIWDVDRQEKAWGSCQEGEGNLQRRWGENGYLQTSDRTRSPCTGGNTTAWVENEVRKAEWVHQREKALTAWGRTDKGGSSGSASTMHSDHLWKDFKFWTGKVTETIKQVDQNSLSYICQCWKFLILPPLPQSPLGQGPTPAIQVSQWLANHSACIWMMTSDIPTFDFTEMHLILLLLSSVEQQATLSSSKWHFQRLALTAILRDKLIHSKLINVHSNQSFACTGEKKSSEGIEAAQNEIEMW